MMMTCGNDYNYNNNNNENNNENNLNNITWTTLQTDFKISTVNDFIYGGSSGQEKYIVVGNGISYSSDLLTWEKIQDTNIFDYSYEIYNIELIRWGNDKFIIATRGEIAYSADGQTWKNVNINNIFDDTYVYQININDIVWGHDKFIAVGKHYGLGMVLYSLDGITWNKIEVSTIKDIKQIDAIIWDNNKFVFLGDGEIAYSYDGLEWTLIPTSGNIYYRNITYGGPIGQEKYLFYNTTKNTGESPFLPSGYSMNLTYTLDFLTWSERINTIRDLKKLLYGNSNEVGLYVGIGGNTSFNNGKLICNHMGYSSDGKTWINAQDNPFYPNNSYPNFANLSQPHFYQLIWNDNKFICIGKDPNAFINQDRVFIGDIKVK